MSEENRIYNKVVNLNRTSIQSFWDSKAKQNSSLESVLLGADIAENSRIIRNNRENQILCDFLGEKESLTVLDIGCGVGRWAYNLALKIKIYHGVDFSSEFIKSASLAFEQKPQYKFFHMSVTQMDLSLLLESYDLIIVAGVAMYINDDEISKMFYYLNKLSTRSSSIFFQESISVLPHRLTLKDFDSVELKSKYNAIYRTGREYEEYFSAYFDHQFDIRSAGLLLDEQTGAREETNIQCWFLEQS